MSHNFCLVSVFANTVMIRRESSVPVPAMLRKIPLDRAILVSAKDMKFPLAANLSHNEQNLVASFFASTDAFPEETKSSTTQHITSLNNTLKMTSRITDIL
jgi:hypothetical protein